MKRRGPVAAGGKQKSNTGLGTASGWPLPTNQGCAYIGTIILGARVGNPGPRRRAGEQNDKNSPALFLQGGHMNALEEYDREKQLVYKRVDSGIVDRLAEYARELEERIAVLVLVAAKNNFKSPAVKE